MSKISNACHDLEPAGFVMGLENHWEKPQLFEQFLVMRYTMFQEPVYALVNQRVQSLTDLYMWEISSLQRHKFSMTLVPIDNASL